MYKRQLIAIGALNGLLSQGVRVPEDVSVAGFGNVLSAENARVPLTTVREPKFSLGLAAMEIMQHLLRGEGPEIRVLRAELVPRRSTAPPAVNPLI